MFLERFEVVPETHDFWPGDEAVGIVVVKVNGRIRSQGIHLKLKGEAIVDIHQEQKSRGVQISNNDNEKSPHNRDFTNSESYFSLETFLVSDGKREVTLKDEFWCPFSFQLPDNLVASFNRPNGKVTYYFELTLKSKGQQDVITRKEINVHTNLDLSSFPESFNSIQYEACKIFGRLCCTSGPLTMYIRIPSQGYLFGETIPFEIELNNLSNKSIKDISVQLFEVATFHGKKKAKNERSAVTPEVKRGRNAEGDVWRGELVIPVEGVIFPTKLGGCSIIDLEYFLMVTAHVGGNKSSDVKVVCRIIVGTSRSNSAAGRFPWCRPVGYESSQGENGNRQVDGLFESSY